MCPVCGFDDLDEPPYSDAGDGLFEICPCCGFQFGVSDDNQGVSFHEWREWWINQGMSWSSKGIPAPQGWDPHQQLSNLTERINNPLNDSLLSAEGES
jgi:hypothetical protein